MASRKSRRPPGHPAKVAARRERERARRERSSSLVHAQRVIASLCREAAGLGSAFEAELWASHLLGLWWPPPLGADNAASELGAGRPIVQGLAAAGGPGALAALLAIGEVSEGELGSIASSQADRLARAGVAPPSWAEAIERAEVLGTAAMRERIFEDGETIFIEARHADSDEVHAIGIYIDHNLGGMAKDLLVADSIESVRRAIEAKPPPDGEIVLEAIAEGDACERVHQAMELTDATLDTPVGEDYASLRAVALLRADELRPVPRGEGREMEVSARKRARLLADFLASPEGAAIEAESDPAEVIRLAIDFCADYVDGRPLRWSPVLVELFMADWLPRKLLAEREMFEAVPDALEAWVRHAGRLRGIPAGAIELTVDAIGEWTEDMLRRSEDPDHGGPGKQLLMAALEAGVQPDDKNGMDTFIAGWNARSLS
jgi:hypothetical protein